MALSFQRARGAAAVATAGRVSRGQRARIFAWVYVAAYLGFGVPSWCVGFLAARSSFTLAFVAVIAALALVAAALPVLGRRAFSREMSAPTTPG